MSATKLFITGATGWIGGAVLGGILKNYPKLEVTALLRSPSQEFAEKYPGVKVVKGSFDDFEVIESATQDAEIIIRKHIFV
jgi:nucleoside-diphosphate-sugar epimerase